MTYRLWRPDHLGLVIADLRKPASAKRVALRSHLTAVIDWLCRAQDRRDGEADAGGVSAGWSFEDGWLPSYPETSGYIVETFLAAAEVLERSELRARANRVLDWELSIQQEDGAFPGHFGEAGSRPVIFNTGQIMHGMLAGYEQLGRSECLSAAVRAGHWMVASQDEDGCWRRNVHNGIPHTYNARAAWALLRAGIASGDSQLQKAAENNVRWAISQQTQSGWFKQNAFHTGIPPFTHTIAYAIRGILEAGLLLRSDEFVARAEKAARGLAAQQRADGWLAGTFSDDWKPEAGYCCLTGLAQSVLIWQRLIHAGAGEGLQRNVRSGIDWLCRNHYLLGDNSPKDGGIAGSLPIWGDYSRFEYPNWAAKFFADALLQEVADIVVPEPTPTSQTA
jgi:hypothetical protein